MLYPVELRALHSEAAYFTQERRHVQALYRSVVRFLPRRVVLVAVAVPGMGRAMAGQASVPPVAQLDRASAF